MKQSAEQIRQGKRAREEQDSIKTPSQEWTLSVHIPGKEEVERMIEELEREIS